MKRIGYSSDLKKISKYGTFAIEIVLLPMLVYNFWDLISTWIDICKKLLPVN